MQNVYVWARKIHRFLIVFILVLGMVMGTTGTMMKYSISFPFFDLFQARLLHNFLSTVFGIVFVLMAITGTYMYLHPFILRFIAKRAS